MMLDLYLLLYSPPGTRGVATLSKNADLNRDHLFLDSVFDQFGAIMQIDFAHEVVLMHIDGLRG